MNSQKAVINLITRRNFMKKTALTTGAITLMARGVALAQDTGLHLWWRKMKVADAGQYEVDGNENDPVATVIAKAIKERSELTPGTEVTSHKQQGGTAVDPWEYSPISTNGVSLSFQNGKWTVTFPANFEYKETRRE